MRMSKEKTKIKSDGSVQEKYKVILRGWEDVGTGWRSRWLRFGTGSVMTHCTLSIGGLTLHVDCNAHNWYPTLRLMHSYVNNYVLRKEVYIGSVERPIYTRPEAVSTWSVIKWKYLFGKRPKTCSTACIEALKQNGIDCPELIVPHQLVRYFKHDYSRAKRKGQNR